jgi:hypothetical protein
MRVANSIKADPCNFSRIADEFVIALRNWLESKFFLVSGKVLVYKPNRSLL